MYWRDWRSLERAVLRFRETKAKAQLAARAEHIPLLSLDEVQFEDIMQELCQVWLIADIELQYFPYISKLTAKALLSFYLYQW